MSKDKSQKQKRNNINKTELWNIFDTEVENPDKKKNIFRMYLWIR
jgi:hypothetical protein